MTEDEQFRVSRAACLSCGYLWIAVVPDDCVYPLECPACHISWGIEDQFDTREEDDG